MEEKYVKNNQKIIDLWKNRFECLFHWDIRFVYDGEHWSHMRFDVQKQIAVIYPCDIDIEEDYLISSVLKLAFIASEGDMNKRLSLIQNLVGIVKKEW